jgi:GH15 family glucan-1,4-alpha-glucosidase
MSHIEDYALLGDLRTAALVGRDGSIDWLCLPDFDSPACFAALLGGPDAGFWRLAPSGAGECTERHYRADTLILESTWETPTGAVRVIDAMPPRGHAADIVRVVEGLRGTVDMTMALSIRFDYGHVVPWVRKTDDGISAVAGPDSLWLRTPAELTGAAMTTGATFTVRPGDRVPFVLTYQPSHLPEPRAIEPERALQDTEDFWSGWVRRARDHDPHVEASVVRSLITLKALTFAPTGGIVAAATTSLPEQVGGARNWDYRYCWLRDATFVLRSFLDAGYTEEARAWREWLLRSVAGDPADLQIMYSITGRRRLPEQTLDWLAGYQDSRPVRTGNAASEQLQLDVWGEVLDSLHLAREAGIAAEGSAWDLQRALLDFLEQHWDEPDNGLWEIRGERRHFVHSKVMAWVGFDRAVQAVENFGLPGPVERWREIRDRIHADVCRHGFDTGRNTFTQFYGSDGVDASLLLLPAVGFLPWTDPRIAGTVEEVQNRLLRDGFLLRYDPAADGGIDGLAGDEGTFTACTFWLAEALAGTGRHSEASELFQRLLALRNDVGLLSEEYDPTTGHHLGNTPQAYSHVGLINAATRLAQTGQAQSDQGKA